MLMISINTFNAFAEPAIYTADSEKVIQKAPDKDAAEVLDHSKIIVRDISFVVTPPGDWKTTSRKLASDEPKVNPEHLVKPKEVEVSLERYVPPKFVEYVLEVRAQPRQAGVPVRVSPAEYSPREFALTPGQLIRISDLEKDYLLKMSKERQGIGTWKYLPVHGYKDEMLFFEYDYRDFETITPYHLPVELALVLPSPQRVTSIYRGPGLWRPVDCKTHDGLCVTEVDQHDELYFIDSLWVKGTNPNTSRIDWQLYYKVGFKRTQPDGNVASGTGWIHSAFAQRKINKIQSDLFISRVPASDSFKTPEQEQQAMNKLFVFDKNFEHLDVKENRFLKNTDPKNIRHLASIYDILIAWDMGVAGSYSQMKQSNLDKPLTQYGATVRIDASAPMFVDLELKGSVSYTAPISSLPEGSSTPGLLKFEQWLTYISPYKVSGHPLRLSLGGYYLTMMHDYLGFKSLLGFQGKVLWESDEMYYFGRVGPLGNNLSIGLSNREVGAGIGIYLDPEKRQDSWSIYTEYSNIDYTHTDGLNIKFQQFQLGIMNSF